VVLHAIHPTRGGKLQTSSGDRGAQLSSGQRTAQLSSGRRPTQH